MSYNLYAEGDLDLFELSGLTKQFTQVELFPLEGKPPAIGIALPSSRADEAAIGELRELIQRLLASEATVLDLFSGDRIASPADLEALRQRILG